MTDERVLVQALVGFELERHGVSHSRVEKLIVKHARLLRKVVDRMDEEKLHVKVEKLKRRLL